MGLDLYKQQHVEGSHYGIHPWNTRGARVAPASVLYTVENFRHFIFVSKSHSCLGTFVGRDDEYKENNDATKKVCISQFLTVDDFNI